MYTKTEIPENVYVAPDADIVGDVELEENCNVWYQAVIRGDADRIHIGRGTNIQDGSILHVDPGFPMEIGENVTIGHGAVLHGCSIGDGSLVGMGAIVLNGAKIGKNCIVGAGALVTQGVEIPDGTMALGVPAKVKRDLREDEIRENLENAEVYVKLAREYDW